MCFYPEFFPEEVAFLWEPVSLLGDTPYGRAPFRLDSEHVPLALDQVRALTVAAPGLVLGLLAGLLIVARLRRGRLTRAGWEIPGTVALALATGTLLTLLPEHPFGYSERGVLGGPYGTLALAMESYTMSLLLVGTVIGLASLSPPARRSGHSISLASQGALLVCLAGIVECHRAILAAWELGLYLEADVAWALRRRLLWTSLFAAALPLLAPGRFRLIPGPAASRHLGTALRATQLALLVVGIAAVDGSVSLHYGHDHALARAPCCAAGTCGAASPYRGLSPGKDYLFFSRNLPRLGGSWVPTVAEARERFEVYAASPAYHRCTEPRRRYW